MYLMRTYAHIHVHTQEYATPTPGGKKTPTLILLLGALMHMHARLLYVQLAITLYGWLIINFCIVWCWGVEGPPSHNWLGVKFIVQHSIGQYQVSQLREILGTSNGGKCSVSLSKELPTLCMCDHCNPHHAAVLATPTNGAQTLNKHLTCLPFTML